METASIKDIFNERKEVVVQRINNIFAFEPSSKIGEIYDYVKELETELERAEIGLDILRQYSELQSDSGFTDLNEMIDKTIKNKKGK